MPKVHAAFLSSKVSAFDEPSKYSALTENIVCQRSRVARFEVS